MSAEERPPSGDQVRISARVDVAQAEAFRVFTEEIDRWWRRGMKYRVSGKYRGILRLEPGVGGRLIESFAVGDKERVVQTGRVLEWSPPARIVFEWRPVNFAPSERTEVQVDFEASGESTVVTVTHRGWSRIRLDHPARHGEEVPAFLRMTGLWWSGLLTSLREYTA
jgi:uncharacterized protein YndB with AHSA1/START domain